MLQRSRTKFTESITHPIKSNLNLWSQTVICLIVLLWLIMESVLIHNHTNSCRPLCNPPLLDSESGSSSACVMTVWKNYYTDVIQAAGNGGLSFQQHGWHASNQLDWEIHWLPGVLHYISRLVSFPEFHLFISFHFSFVREKKSR